MTAINLKRDQNLPFVLFQVKTDVEIKMASATKKGKCAPNPNFIDKFSKRINNLAKI